MSACPITTGRLSDGTPYSDGDWPGYMCGCRGCVYARRRFFRNRSTRKRQARTQR